MILKEIINKSYYGTISYIPNKEYFSDLERYIKYNLEVLKEFKSIIIATNYKDIELVDKNAQLWKKYFPDCVLLDLPKNRGHNFGTSDLDTALFNYCKKNNIEWLCKTSSDIILEQKILDTPIKEADFYYLEGIGYGGLVSNGFDRDIILNDYFFPQTNFYIINVSKVDYLNDQEYIEKTYTEIQNIPKQIYETAFNSKPWGPFPGWACEQFLANCVLRNDLIKYHLLSQEKYLILLGIIEKEQIHDCSHKNIMLEGICHFHNVDDQVLILN